MKEKSRIREKLDKLVEVELLIKDNNGYMASSFSKKIDKMHPQSAFIEGMLKGYKKYFLRGKKIGYNKALDEVEKFIDENSIGIKSRTFGTIKRKLKELKER